ncbi:MAG: nucleolar RNA-binding Nop10p family protein [Candidatus Micrarchaeia archaeon]
MKQKLRKCYVCGRYTMRTECCGKETRKAHPAKYSQHNYAAKYRRKNL